MVFAHEKYTTERYSLVISGGGTRGFYALGVLRALEELGLDKNVDAIYGVSAGAIIGTYRAAGYKAEWIFYSFLTFKIFSWKLGFLPIKSLLPNDSIKTRFKKDLPSSFEKLKKRMYIGCVDTNQGTYVSFSSGSLQEPILGSMSLPGVFPPVPFDNYTLLDGGILNNYPIEIAKADYPTHKTIGIYLNQFFENQKIRTMLDQLSIAYEITMRGASLAKVDMADYFFCGNLSMPVLSVDKSKMEEIYRIGYEDGIEKFSK